MNEKLSKERKRQLSLTHSSALGLQDHLEQLIDVLTETMFRKVTCALFAQHQTTFSFLLCCNIMKYSTDQDTGTPLIDKTDWSLFIWGASSPAFADRHFPSPVEGKKSVGTICMAGLERRKEVWAGGGGVVDERSLVGAINIS